MRQITLYADDEQYQLQSNETNHIIKLVGLCVPIWMVWLRERFSSLDPLRFFSFLFFSNSLRLLPARPTGICSITWQGLVRRFCEWLTAVLLPSRPSLAFHVVPRHDLAHLERHRNHSLLIHGYCRLAAATACGRTKHRVIPRSGLTEERYLFPWKHGPSGCWRWRESGCLVGVSSPCWDLSVGICADSRESALS